MNRSASARRWEVLIVDPSDESREVFRTVLARRGLSTIETSCMDDGLQLARTHRPRVIVVDLDDNHDADEIATCARYEQECRRQQSALLVLGIARSAASGLEDEQVVAKPYHYGPLIRKIEQLCGRTADD